MNKGKEPQDEAPEEAVEADEAESEGEDTAPEKVEAEARKMGWVPQAEFRGPKDQWRDADEFVERGRTVLPIIRSQLDKEREKNTALANKIERMERENAKTFKRLERMSEVALNKQREQLEAQFKGQKEAAVESGDIDRYRALDKAEQDQLADLDKKARPTEEKDDALAGAPAEFRPILRDWLLDNAWFSSDQEMAAVAQAEHMRLNKIAPIESADDMADNLKRVASYVKKRYPEKFDNGSGGEPQRSRVEGGSRSGGGVARGLYSKLPADAKAVADTQINLYLQKGETADKDAAKAKERWAKVYFDQPGT